MGGTYWKMWHFEWENGGFVFKPNYMSKKYAVMILHTAGALISLAAVVAVIEDTVSFKRGTFNVAGSTDIAILENSFATGIQAVRV